MYVLPLLCDSDVTLLPPLGKHSWLRLCRCLSVISSQLSSDIAHVVKGRQRRVIGNINQSEQTYRVWLQFANQMPLCM